MTLPYAISYVVRQVAPTSTSCEQARSTLVDGFWVGVTCDVDELVRREAARGDRYSGFASSTSAVVHRDMTYDLVVDTTTTPSDTLTHQIYDAVTRRE